MKIKSVAVPFILGAAIIISYAGMQSLGWDYGNPLAKLWLGLAALSLVGLLVYFRLPVSE